MRASSVVGWSLCCLAAAACTSNDREPGAAVVRVDTVAALELFEPVAMEVGSDNSVFILDRGNSELYQVRESGTVDTLARKGSGPGELLGPTSFSLLGDSAVVVADEGNARIQTIPRRSRAVRTVPYSEGAHTGVFGDRGGLFYAAAYGQNFALENGQPVVKQKSLITVVFTRDGAIRNRFGTPRPYPGKVLPIFGNLVRVARDPRSGDIWIAWPLDPVMERYDPSGRRVGVLERALPFQPPLPTEEQTARSPLPVADFQQVTFDLKVDSSGRLYVLTAAAAKDQSLQSKDYRTPPQAVEIFSAEGALACRLPLPFTATSLALAGKDELLFADLKEAGAIYRVRYRCPGLKG